MSVFDVRELLERLINTKRNNVWNWLRNPIRQVKKFLKPIRAAHVKVQARLHHPQGLDGSLAG